MAKAKVPILNQEHESDYKVYFLNQSYMEKNAQMISGVELIDQEYKADVNVFIVD